ncbi:MAG: hypothetical protein E6R04_11155 [Spirochaetes bacterium]|nr:MAG: hypothetical protein E6R04_11155 [Spirochaetota bacterium]
MKFKNNVRFEVGDFSIASVLKILADHGIAPEAARLETEIEYDYGTFGTSSRAVTHLCFVEELDAAIVKARIDKELTYNGTWFVSAPFTNLLRQAAKVWTETQRRIFMDAMGISESTLYRWSNGERPTDVKKAYVALSAVLS